MKIVWKKFVNYYLPFFLSVVLLATAGFFWLTLQAPQAEAAISCSTTTNTSKTTGSVTSTTLQFLGAVGSGDTLFAAVWVNDQGRTVTVSDDVNAGNYNQDATQTQTSVGFSQLYVFTKLNSGAGTPTVTLSVSGAAVVMRLLIASCSGLATSNALDKTASQDEAATHTQSSGPTATRSQAAELLFGFGITTLANSTYTAGAGFTLLNQEPSGVDSGRDATEFQIVSVTGTDAATFTTNQGNNGASTIVATYKAITSSIKTGNFVQQGGKFRQQGGSVIIK